MKTSNIFWGTLLIVSGLLFLLVSLSAISLDWENIWRFWPLIIIVLGISLIVTRNVSFGSDYSTKEYSEAFDSSITEAILFVEGGACNIKIGSSTKDLYFAKTECAKNIFNLIKSGTNNIAKINFSMRNVRFLYNNIKCMSKMDIALNENPSWKLNFKLGAASSKLDLKKHKVEDINIELGAAKLDVILGALSKQLNFKLKSGVSQIEILVPEEVGCEIVTDDVVSKKDIQGFNKIRGGLYQSEGYNNAEKKIFISIDCGVSSITIRRYPE